MKAYILVIALLWTVILASAKDTTIDAYSDYTTVSKDSMDEFKRKFEYLNSSSTEINTSDFKQPDSNFMFDVMSAISSKNGKSFATKEEIEQINAPQKRTLMLFYFFSRSVPPSSWNYFFAQADKLSEYFKSYAVLVGHEKATEDVISEKADKENLKNNIPYNIRVHPIMFDELNITQVPSIVMAECDAEFKWKSCDFLYRVDGDITLDRFFEIVGEVNDEYSKYFNILVGI